VVAVKTMTATIKIFPPAGTSDPPAVNTNLTYAPGTGPDPLYGGADGAPARIQVLNSQQAATEVGSQTQVTAGYLVAIDREADDVPTGAVVQIITCTDPDLRGTTRLYVSHIDRGSLRFERDIYCVDDLSALHTS
jgi:hypothetical protein